MLDQERYQWLKETAFRHDTSIAQIVRNIIDRVRNEQGKKEQQRILMAHRSLLKLLGKGKKGPSDVSERHDEYLGEDIYKHMMKSRT